MARSVRWQRSSAGTWTLDVCDGAEDDNGTLDRWALYFVRAEGTAADSPGAVGTFAATLTGANPSATASEVTVIVDRPRRVRAVLVDATGRELRVASDGVVADRAAIAVDVRGLAAGAYFVRVEAGDSVSSVPLTVVR